MSTVLLRATEEQLISDSVANDNLPRRTTDFVSYLDIIKPQIDGRIAHHLSDLLPLEDLDGDISSMLLTGKRLRAGMTMLIFDEFAPEQDRRGMALDLAAAIEMAHSASLIMDDMIDGDKTRRGLPSLHISKGRRRAILETIRLLSLPYELVARYGDIYVQDLSAVHRQVVGGAINELEMEASPCSPDVYYDMITRKTGELFGLAARYGALAAGCVPNVVDGLCRYGKLVGETMQVADDIADLDILVDDNDIEFGSEMILIMCTAQKHQLAGLVDDLKARRLQHARAEIDIPLGIEGLGDSNDGTPLRGDRTSPERR